MRLVLIAGSVLVSMAVGILGFRLWQFSRQWPDASSEVVQLTLEKRALLVRLRAEPKFAPNDFPPSGYTGIDTPEDQPKAVEAVNDVVDGVLSQSDQAIQAKFVSALIAKSMRDVFMLATEDRDRTQGYMLEIWYILGFKIATGRFLYGSAYVKPEGYDEPLPPGWAAPNKPRIIR